MPAWLALIVVAATASGPSNARVALDRAHEVEPSPKTGGTLESYGRARDQAAPGSTERADALLGLAGVESDIGLYRDAGRDAREAARIYQHRGDGAGASNALNRAGLAALYEGDYSSAEKAIREALTVGGPSGDPDARAEQIANLANVHFFTGRYADAARLYDDALRITDRFPSSAWAPRRRRILQANRASLFQRLGRDEDALAIYRSLDERAEGLQPSEQAQLLVNLGVLYRRLGDPVKALETYDRARALFVQDHHADGELGVLKNRGIVLALDLGRHDEAVRTFTDALATATRVGNRREILHARVYRGEAALRAGRIDDARADFDAALALSRELSTPEEEWKALYGLGRAAPEPAAAFAYLQQSVATIEQVREQIRVPSLRSDFLNDKREVYDALLAATLARGDGVAAVFGVLERSHSRGWRERLGLPSRVELSDVQTAIPDGVLLLDYWSAPQGAVVVGVTRTTAQVMPITVHLDAVGEVSNRLSAGPGDDVHDTARLGRILPPLAWLDGISHVVIVPDGALSLVPFEALPVGRQRLVERAAVSYMPTAAVLVRPTSSSPRWLPPWRTVMRAFADPVVGTGVLDDADALRTRLAATGPEVRAIADQLGGKAELHVGADDRKAFLARGPDTPPLLHLATHAMADANALEQSRILFSPRDGEGAAADYLFLKEAYALELNGVELAVLSACETERGRLLRAEGVQSFSRAFLAAGARSTVTTLWRVADRPTSEFMTIFYHHLQRGVPRDEALRRAKLRFLQSGTALADPHYWAAFVLSGDGLRPVPRAIAWHTVILSGVSLAAACWLVVSFVHRLARRVPSRAGSTNDPL